MAFGPFATAADLTRLLAEGHDVVLVDARQKNEEPLVAGAVRADLERELSAAAAPGHDSARGGRHPLPPIEAWSQTLGRWGVTPQTFVAAFDDQSGANAAARVWWMLRSVGHANAAILDGPLPEHVPAPSARAPYPATSWQRPIVDLARVDELRHDDTWRVLDVRSRERYRGETEPIDPIAGHIPGAVNLPFAENLREGRFKSPEELRAQYEELLGGLPAERLVVHCGSGVTACHTLAALEAAGLHGASLYVGSWGEWCRNPMPREPQG
jgi:thiosulfate/3-mercaptopyruvate sulfurtransferase